MPINLNKKEINWNILKHLKHWNCRQSKVCWSILLS